MCYYYLTGGDASSAFIANLNHMKKIMMVINSYEVVGLV